MKGNHIINKYLSIIAQKIFNTYFIFFFGSFMYYEASNGFNYTYNKIIYEKNEIYKKNFHFKTCYYSIQMYISKDNIDKISTTMNVNNLPPFSHDM
jgi:hypothetical protein